MISRIDIEDMTADRIEEALLPCPFCGGPGEVMADMGGLVGCHPCALARRDVASWNRRADLARPSQAGDDRVARLIRAAERFAGWTIGGKIVDDPENREKYPLLVAEVLELRAALAAMDTPKGGGDE